MRAFLDGERIEMSFSRMKIGYYENRNIDECRRKPIDVGGMGARISAFTSWDIDDCRNK